VTTYAEQTASHHFAAKYTHITTDVRRQQTTFHIAQHSVTDENKYSKQQLFSLNIQSGIRLRKICLKPDTKNTTTAISDFCSQQSTQD